METLTILLNILCIVVIIVGVITIYSSNKKKKLNQKLIDNNTEFFYTQTENRIIHMKQIKDKVTFIKQFENVFDDIIYYKNLKNTNKKSIYIVTLLGKTISEMELFKDNNDNVQINS